MGAIPTPPLPYRGHIRVTTKRQWAQPRMEDIMMKRANKITVTVKDGAFVGTFRKTHNVVAVVSSTEYEGTEYEFKPTEDANQTLKREEFRKWCIVNCKEFGVDYSTTKAQQGWERKYDKYYKNEEILEDARVLVQPVLEELVSKSKYGCEIQMVTLDGIMEDTSHDNDYILDGRYTKSNAWAYCTITLAIDVLVDGHTTTDVYMTVFLKSGQMCKPKMSAKEWDEFIVDGLGSLVDTTAGATA